MAEINKDQRSIPNTHNDFYYKRKNENALLLLTQSVDPTSVYTVLFYIFNLNAYSSRDWSMISILLSLQNIMEDVRSLSHK